MRARAAICYSSGILVAGVEGRGASWIAASSQLALPEGAPLQPPHSAAHKPKSQACKPACKLPCCYYAALSKASLNITHLPAHL